MKIKLLIISFMIGMIVEVLMEESLRQAFAFSFLFGIILFFIFLVYQFADYYKTFEPVISFFEGIYEDYF